MIARNSWRQPAPSSLADSNSAASILAMPVSSRTVQKPSRTQTPIRPTAGSAVSKSPSQARAMPPRPIAVEDLVDQPGQRQQPAPDDAGGDERDDLRQEQDGPGDRAQPPARDAMDHARRHEPEAHRDEAVEQDQPERVEERLDELRIAQDGHVVRQPDPRRGADAVPAVQRVLHRQGEWLEHEHGVHRRGPAARTASRRGSVGGSPGPGDPPGPWRRRAAEPRGLGTPCLGLASSAAWFNDSSSFWYSAWTAFSRPAASCLPPTSFWSSGVQPWAKIEPVALAMKSIAPLSLATSAPAASVSIGDRAGRRRRHRQVGRAARVRATDGDVDLAGGLVGRHPVEEGGGAIGVLRRVGDAVRQGRRHRRQ